MKKIEFKWSKKNIIIVSAVAAAVIIAVVLTLVFTLGGSAEKMESRYKSSVKSVASVVKTTEIKDGETSVEKRVETITFSKGDEAEVVTAITKINEFNAEMNESTTTASGEIDRTSLVAVNLGTNVFESGYSYKCNVFKGKVSAKNASKFFPEGSVSVDGEIDVEVVFKGSKISEITCRYKTETGLSASLKITYSYGR